MMLFMLGGVSGFFFYSVTFPLLDVDELPYGVYSKPTCVLGARGTELFRFEREHRTPITLSQVSPHVINAFLAAEDRTFFDHQGISLRGILRAIVVNLWKRRFVQGASTITQQVIKLRFAASQRTLARKVREQVLALLVEGLYSKEQILETYLNLVYLGAGLYGIEAAAQSFWKKSAAELTPAEAALLAGIVKSPQSYCPVYDLERAKKRRNIVLQCMRRCGFLDDAVYTSSSAESIVLTGRAGSSSVCSGYIREHIQQELEQLLGRDRLYNYGCIVQTTLDEQMQQRAEEIFATHVSEIKKKKANVDGAAVILEGESGAIRAFIGGYDFSRSQFNRAFQAKRQIGSLVKPLVYIASLQQLGATFRDTCVDEILPEISGWSPRNVTRRFEGEMTLAHALVVSNNIIPVKLFLEVGADPIIRVLRACGLPGPFDPYPALALGCTECTPVDVAQMFNTVIQQGVSRPPYCIEWIKDASGKKVFRRDGNIGGESAVSWFYSSQVVSVLQLISRRMSASYPGKWIAGDFACKTGTTNQQRSCWFAGATPRYTGVVYLGCDSNDSLERVVYSGRHAMPLLVEILRPFSSSEDHFYHAPGLVEVFVNPKTGAPYSEYIKGCYSFLCPEDGAEKVLSRKIC